MNDTRSGSDTRYKSQSPPFDSLPVGVHANHQVLALMLPDTARTLQSARQTGMLLAWGVWARSGSHMDEGPVEGFG